MKVFGFNILTDAQLAKREEDHWERVKKFLKIKELWYIHVDYVKKKKCSSCNDNRQLKVVLPDGSTTTVNCSCNGLNKVYLVKQDNRKEILIIKNEGIFVADGLDGYRFEKRIIFKKSELKGLKNPILYAFTSKRLCEEALKIIIGGKNEI